MINEVLDVMVELANEGMTMMVVTHEMGFARKVANRVIFMDEGKIVEDADKEAFFANPQSDRAKDFLAKINRYSLRIPPGMRSLSFPPYYSSILFMRPVIATIIYVPNKP